MKIAAKVVVLVNVAVEVTLEIREDEALEYINGDLDALDMEHRVTAVRAASVPGLSDVGEALAAQTADGDDQVAVIIGEARSFIARQVGEAS